MDFGVVGLEGLVSPSCPGAQGSSDAKSKGVGSGFLKQERSGSEEDDWKALKMAKIDDFSTSKTMPLHQSNPRSNALLSADHNHHHQEQMLSFSSLKSEASFICKDGVVMERATQDGAFPYLQPVPSSYTRNPGYGTAAGSLGSSNKNGHFGGIRGPFTPFQWSELQHQALIYKYLTSNVPVPSNLLIPIKRSFNAYGLSYPSNSFGWGSFHLGFSGNSDPEPGRCRRTDGKKWRCSRDAVADQKYCERHINRGRHRSRKPVEGQTGHAASGTGTTNSNPKVVPPSPVMPSGSASNSLAIQKHHFKNVQPGAAAAATAIFPPQHLINRMQETQGLSMMSSAINLKPHQDNPFQELTPLEFGLVSSDSLLNPSQSSPYMASKNMDLGSLLDFSNQEAQEQHPLLQFMDDWPKDQPNGPEDCTQLSMSIPVAMSDFSSSSSSPTHEKLALSPLRLCQMGSGDNPDDLTQKQTTWMPNSWKDSMGGPLGEVLTNSSSNSSELSLLAEGRNSSPTGVLQKAVFGALSNSSSGSSPRGDRVSFFDDVLGSSLASSSIPSL